MIDVQSKGSAVPLHQGHECTNRPPLPWSTLPGCSHLWPLPRVPISAHARAVSPCLSNLVAAPVSSCIAVMPLPAHRSHWSWLWPAGWHPDLAWAQPCHHWSFRQSPSFKFVCYLRSVQLPRSCSWPRELMADAYRDDLTACYCPSLGGTFIQV